MKKTLSLILAVMAISCSVSAQTDYTSVAVINSDTALYSRLLINSCLGNFSGNKAEVGFNTFNVDGSAKATATHSKTKIDYVPGLVAKAVIECVDFYANVADLTVFPAGERDFFKPWYYSVEWYGNKFASTVENSGVSLDNLNAVKLYFKLGELAAQTSIFAAANASTITNCNTAKSNALTGLGNTNSTYSIKAGTIDGTNNANALPAPGGGTYDVTGGWWHKSNYNNQLWCDGQYMGPALLAQYVAAGQYISGSADGDWNIIMKQFDITWTYLWNSTDKLLYHAFCADGGTNSSSLSTDWAGLSNTSGSECYHSADYWGRAEGWYVLALIDVLEQMDKAGMSKTDARYQRLLGYLQSCASGLLARQDASGCWCQLLGYPNGTSFTDYKDKNGNTVVSGTKTNYLEASASAIFTAVFLKGLRLGYLDKATYEAPAKNAYHGFLQTFLAKNIDGNPYGLIYGCASAGLGGSGNTGTKLRSGSAEYYLFGSDVTKITDYTEGKVLGAFILAATEYERTYVMPNLKKIAADDCNCLTVTLQ